MSTSTAISCIISSNLDLDFISSGCITSAESVLITQQSQEELYKIIKNNHELAEVFSVHELHSCIAFSNLAVSLAGRK